MAVLFSGSQCFSAGTEAVSKEIRLREWRMFPDHLSAQMEPEFHGRQFAVKVRFPDASVSASARNTASTALNIPQTSAERKKQSRRITGKLELAKHELHRPLQQFIPPYIGIFAKQVSIAIFPVSSRGRISLALRTAQRDKPAPRAMKMHGIRYDRLVPGKWNEFTFDLQTDTSHRLAEVSLIVSGTDESSCEFYFADARIICRDGSSYSLLNPDPPRYTEGMTRPLGVGMPKDLPKRTPIYIGFGASWWILYNAHRLNEIGSYMKKYLPEYDIVLSCATSPEPEVVEILPKLPENIYYQFQRAQHGIEYPALLDALPRDWKGRQQNKRFNSTIATHPVIQDALKEQAEYAVGLGVNSFKQFDYVWMYLNYDKAGGGGGDWGVDKATVRAFRDDLAGRDEGLAVLSESDRRKQTIHFRDYFSAYHGMMFQPEDLGLGSWDEFCPVGRAQAKSGNLYDKRKFSLYNALCHYEWLRQAQRYNNIPSSVPYTVEYTLNGENWTNANDYVYIMKLVGTGTIFKEFFIWTPKNLEGFYRDQNFYLRTARRLGKKYGACMEVSSGGGGHPYWDLKTAYVVSYFLSALGMDTLHHDFQSNGPWDAKHNPGNPVLFTTFRNFMACARGFRQAKLDRSVRLKTDVRHVMQRSAIFITGGNNYPVDDGFASWGPMLVKAGINYEQTEPRELPLLLPSTRVLFFGSPVCSPETAAQIGKWLSAGNKTLLLHSYVPFSHAKGRIDLRELLAEPGQKDGAPLFRGFQNGRFSGKAVLTTKSGSPLLSCLERGNGSRVYYVHSPLQSLSSLDKQNVMAHLSENLPLPHLTVASDDSAVVARYDCGKYQTAVLWNRALVSAVDGKVVKNWHKDKWQWKRQFYDPAAYLFRYVQPGAFCETGIPVSRNGKWRVFYFLADREIIVESVNRVLPLKLSDALTDILYFAPDTPEFRIELEKIKKERQITVELLKEAAEYKEELK